MCVYMCLYLFNEFYFDTDITFYQFLYKTFVVLEVSNTSFYTFIY